jgi:hypothetical protein
VVIPLFASLVVGLLMFLLLGRPLAAITSGLTNWLNGLSGGSVILLGIILGLMMCFDLGGPVNKAAYAFATAGLNIAEPASLRIMAAVILLLLLALAWWQHGITMRNREIAAVRLERDGWQQASATLRKSNDTLSAALHEQNAAVDALKADADKRVLAGQKALGRARGHAAAREVLAARIDAEKPPQGDCRTGPAVMAAKGEL